AVDAARAVVAGAAVVGVVAPVALDQPARAAEALVAVERPGALVGVFRARAVVPPVAPWVGERFAQLVAAHVRECVEPLTVRAGGTGVAARVAVEIEVERELHRDAADRAPAVPGAVARMLPREIGIDRVVPVGDRV